MIDETDLSQEKKWFHEERAKMVVTNLLKRNIGAHYVPTREKALSVTMEMIAPGVTVARGDSISLDQVGVVPALIKRNQNVVIQPNERDADGCFLADPEERHRMQRQAFFSDVFLTGTNAITLDGKLVNVDGLGNRVSAMIFGPDKVIVIAGVNKIVRDVEEALKRIRELAAPMNAKRHYLKHHRPNFGDLACVRTGRCVDCNHDWRICRHTVIIEGAMIDQKERMNVILVGEELGI